MKVSKRGNRQMKKVTSVDKLFEYWMDDVWKEVARVRKLMEIEGYFKWVSPDEVAKQIKGELK